MRTDDPTGGWLIDWLREQDWADFAMDCVEQFDKYDGLTEGQWAAAERMHDKIKARG